MKARFLLGPAGSGKTFRCLAGIRAALQTAPDGPPLILLAPKQATFQLERQLLATSDLAGTTRLRILSFDRLASFLLEELRQPPPPLLSEEGRIMVLRALLRQHQAELPLFGGSLNRPGLARELAAQLAELQQHGFSALKLSQLAQEPELNRALQAKLRDLARLLEKYDAWLTAHHLQDANCLLDFATLALRNTPPKSPRAPGLAGLWLDGFAEMTPQEQGLLAAVIPFCHEATLAFCLGTETDAEPSRLSIWSPISKSYRQCRTRLEALTGCTIEVETLRHEPGRGRFANHPAFAALEANWARPVPPSPGNLTPPAGLRVVGCSTPEAEAVFAAREILRFVRTGHRFRDCAVLVRQLEPYHQTLARVFRRYGIPCFLDRRESVAHHPLAELTRNALRTVAFDWPTGDWFAALKTGFAGVPAERIDALENAALEFGWRGQQWREPLPDDTLEPLRQLLLPPFERLYSQLSQTGGQPSGTELAAALRTFWDDLDAGETLERWTRTDATNSDGEAPAVHATVWDQMQTWLDNVQLAFPNETMPLADWLPVLEAGLMNLTVGVIPPSLDEVLIGAIDRARNPDLKYAFILGVNESVFPAPPAAPIILTAADREQLELQQATLGPDVFERISREQYLGYIACTRSEQHLAVTFTHQDAAGETMSPSPFIRQLQKIFPGLAVEAFTFPFLGETGLHAEHACELAAPLVKFPASSPPATHWPRLLDVPGMETLAEALRRLTRPATDNGIPPELAEQIYGPVLHSSVSRLEDFAQCPFRFFVHSGLHAEERKQFDLDARERGNFQHAILERFHQERTAAGQRWRDLTPEAAKQRIGEIAAELATDGKFREGLLQQSAQTRFTAQMLTEPVQEFVATLVTWMHRQYDFDPVKSEFAFGFTTADNGAPAWNISLDERHQLALRGRIDRIDVCRDANRALVTVMDYKASQRKLDALLMANGLQLQLAGYLAAIQSWSPEIFAAGEIVPAGMFYINLRGQHAGGADRAEVLHNPDHVPVTWQHSGRFDAAWLKKFDRRPDAVKGDQFKYKLNKDGRLPSNSKEAVATPVFRQLLQDVEAQLRGLGQKIYAGTAAVDPYRKGNHTACEYCDYASICRIDRWTQVWRTLTPAAGTDADESE